MTRIWWILTWAREILKISTLIGSFCATYITFDRKIKEELFFMDNEEWCNIWRITDLWFGQWHEKYDTALKSHQSAQKPQNWDLMRFFYPMQKIYELTIYRGVMWHDNEEWCKICRGIDLSIQNWHHNLTPEHSNVSKICTLMDSFWPNCMFELKKYRRVCLMALKIDAKKVKW